MMTDPDRRHADPHPQRQPHRAARRGYARHQAQASASPRCSRTKASSSTTRSASTSPTKQGQPTFQPPAEAERAQARPAGLPEVWAGRRAGHSPHPAGQPAGPSAVSPARELKPVLDGLGIAILSTSKGVMSDRRRGPSGWAASCSAPCGKRERWRSLMSRIGKQPVVVPAGVKVQVADGKVRVEGPKGKLELSYHREHEGRARRQGEGAQGHPPRRRAAKPRPARPDAQPDEQHGREASPRATRSGSRSRASATRPAWTRRPWC